MKKHRTRSDPGLMARRSAVTARKAHETMGAAAEVIAARTAMTMAAPSVETGIEMNLMVSEKVAAFSESGAAVARGAGEMATRGARYATAEASAAGQAMAELAACKTPVELMLAQSRLMTNFFTRAFAHGLGMGAVATRTGERALGPIHKTVTANSKRLKK